MNYAVKRKLVKLKWLVPNAASALLPMNDEIVLESNPDMSCNTYALYQFFLKKGLNSKYKLTWIVDNPEQFKDIKIKNVSFIARNPSNPIDRMKLYVRINRAKAAIACNRPFSSLNAARGQLNIYLDHGSHLKNMKVDGRRCTLDCGYLISQSSFFVPYHVDQYTVTEDQVVCTGLPRNDELYVHNDSLPRLIADADRFKKVILWAPTFRQHANGKRVDTENRFPLGLPLLTGLEDAARLDAFLQEHQMLLIIKPHPVQDLSYLKEIDLQNIRTIYNPDLAKAGIQLNELMEQTDAMITDYSSIYYDYMLLDKPIALTTDDLDNYQNDKGFVFDNVYDIIKGEHLKNTDELLAFLTDVCEGRDRMLAERTAVKEKINDFLDGNSSRRVYDFIIKKLK